MGILHTGNPGNWADRSIVYDWNAIILKEGRMDLNTFLSVHFRTEAAN